MEENVYEGMFILDANRFARDAAAASGKVEKLIKAAGAELLVSRLWEERRLAYSINGQRKGAYWLTYFRVEGEKIRGLDRQCRISDGILRHMFLKIDPRIVDALLQHVQDDGKATGDAPSAGKKEEAEVAVSEGGGDGPAAASSTAEAGPQATESGSATP
ncbi:MAG: 30S ribosomal protein S6 [Pirellulales bacterium]